MLFLTFGVYITANIRSVTGQIKLTSNKEVKKMTQQNNQSESKRTLESLKTEAANSLNVNLKQGYNGDLTSREAGSVGGEMVKRMIAYASKNMK